MEVAIREGTRNDLRSVLRLINELAVFERAPNEVQSTIAQLAKDGFDDEKLFKVIMAESTEKNGASSIEALHEDGVVGMALYYFGYSTWKGKMLYLDDIIVQEEFRQMHVGSKLFEKIMDIAKEENVNQIRFQVLDWNESAIKFYKRYNTTMESDWITCKLVP